MGLERTLIIIKPDGLMYKNEIKKRVLNAGLRTYKEKRLIMFSEIASKFYSHVKKINDKIYQDLVENYVGNQEVIAMVLEGEDAVQKLRKITGYTDPETSLKGTIRGDLGTDKKRIADLEERATRNLVHASGSSEEAEKEISFLFS